MLLEFISRVYGPYVPNFRNKLRSYIRQHDPALYTAIASFEYSGGVLPPEIYLPTQRELSDERLARAMRGEFGQLTNPDRAKVRRRLWRIEAQLR